MSMNVQINGFLADSGQRYVRIPAENGSAILRHQDFSIANKLLAADLVAAGLPLFADEDLKAIVEEVRALTHFQPGIVVEHPGWNGKKFALLNGKVIAAEGPATEVLFQTNPARVSKRSTLKSWRLQVSKEVKYHPLPAFALMTMFVPPLLRFMPQVGNITFELVGPGGISKSMVQTVAASAVGPRHYVTSLRDVLRDLKGAERLSRDYPLLIDNVAPALAAATKPRKAEIFTAIDHDLARAPGGRLTLLSSRQPLRECCSMPTMEDSVITILIPPDRQSLLASLSEDFDSYAAQADSLLTAASLNHGVAFPAFMKRLHADFRADSKAVRAKIDRLQEEFLALPQIQANNGIEYRVVRAFAAVYTAARLAGEYKVIPKQFRCRQTLLAVLGLCQQAAPARLPILDRLENLVGSGQLVTITKEANPEAQALAIGNAIGSLTINLSERIVKIPTEKIEQAFPDWKLIRGTPDVSGPRGPLKRDRKNLTTWGHLAPGMPRMRLHQFVLPPAAADESMFAELGDAATT